MPRLRRRTSFSASCSVWYGHMRVPPSAGPSTVLWIAMMAFRPASLLWQNTTCSWPKVSRVSKIIGCSASASEGTTPTEGGKSLNRRDSPKQRARSRPLRGDSLKQSVGGDSAGHGLQKNFTGAQRPPGTVDPTVSLLRAGWHPVARSKRRPSARRACIPPGRARPDRRRIRQHQEGRTGACMPSSINDHVFLSNTRGSALVDRSGCIDWLCLPRFDSPACFAALLGTPEHGCWELAPAGEPTATRQRYRDDTLVVETEIQVPEGTICIADCMPIDPDCAEVIRVVRGVSGRVPMRMRFRPRFQFGSCTPELVDRDGVVVGHAGDEALAFNASVPCRVEDGEVRADFELEAGDRVTFAMTFARGERPPDPPMDPD